MNRISAIGAALLVITITSSAMTEDKAATSIHACQHFLLVRGDKVTRLNREEFQEWAKSSTPPFLIVGASEITESDGVIDAKGCDFLMSFRQTSIQGQVARFQFTPQSQSAVLHDAQLRVSVAVIGPDLTDFAKINAKTATLDTKGYRLQSVDSNTSIDFSERK